MFREGQRERQIEFPPQQTHLRIVTPALLAISIACIVIVIIVLLAHPSGSFIGPWG
jgi:hypothetical protein